MSNYKKYPHVPCDSVVLRLDKVLESLECHVRGFHVPGCLCLDIDGCEEEIRQLREVIARRGKTLSVQRRRGARGGTYMTIR